MNDLPAGEKKKEDIADERRWKRKSRGRREEMAKERERERERERETNTYSNSTKYFTEGVSD